MECKYCKNKMTEKLIGVYNDSEYTCPYCGSTIVYSVGSGIPSGGSGPCRAWVELNKLKEKEQRDEG